MGTPISARHGSRKPMLQTSVNKQMAPQHYHFTTLQLLLCSCSKHFLAYCMKKMWLPWLCKILHFMHYPFIKCFWGGGREEHFYFQFTSCRTQHFPWIPVGFCLLFASFLVVIALSLFMGSWEMESCYADIKGRNCMLVNMRARGISDGIRNHKIPADVSVPGGRGSSC